MEPITPHSFSSLGGLDRTLDTRDIMLGAKGAPVYNFPPTLTNDRAWSQPVEYQGQQPACGSHSGVAIKGIVHHYRESPRFTWGDIKSFDGYPVDAGTDIRSVFKSITRHGTVDFPLVGNEVTLPANVYARPPLTAIIESNAKTHIGDGYGFIQDISFNGLKQFISDHGPAILQLQVGAEWWSSVNGTNSWAESDILPLRPPAIVVDGHFVVMHSYDENYIYFINSWSDAWGRWGHGYFGANYVPFIRDAGTLISLIFNKDLYEGMTDPDVLLLQQTLNKNPQTQVAITGPGSPGHETDFFGNLTFNAVVKFQHLHSIIPSSGYVGPLTRAILNSAGN